MVVCCIELCVCVRWDQPAVMGRVVCWCYSKQTGHTCRIVRQHSLTLHGPLDSSV